MILVLGCTGDGRRLVRSLVDRGFQVGVIPSSRYGKGPAAEDGAVVVREEEFRANPGNWLQENHIEAVVDARHPFVSDRSRNPGCGYAGVCESNGIPFYRIGREETVTTDSDLVCMVNSMDEAAEKASRLGKCIFLTTGSSGLEPFLNIRDRYGLRVVVRVLPEHRVVRKCQDMGVKPKDIVAMQGPFSKQVNKALFKMFKASVIVTRDSGKAGGVDTKLAAARALKIPVIIVKRAVSGPLLYWEEVLNLLTG